MAANGQQGKFPIILELTPKGLFGAAIVCFCIFLWMFLLGVWAGQTILLPVGQLNGGVESSVAMPAATPEKPAAASRQPQGSSISPLDGQQESVSAPVDDSSFFALQVGAFSTEDRARNAARTWLERGFVAFYQAPAGDGDSYWRAFVGRFDELAEANALVDKLRKDENVKSFISLVPSSEVRKP